jgi:prepilin-type N-terminal cleavage/methylation domain-containing protein
MRRTPTHADRGGFTLVELLVVITILAILFSLAAVAVVKAIGKGDEARERNEISQLSNAIQAFKAQFSAPYLPSHFTARATYAVTDPDLIYLKSVWPRIGIPSGSAIAVNWGALNTAVAAAGNAGLLLKGNQSLVLFLAGPDGVSGFSNSPTDPMAAPTTPGQPRIGPFFEFDPNRLTGDLTKSALSYKDIYGTPYVYFTSYKAGNDYNPQNLDTASVNGVTIIPYQISTSRFANANGFQIISAGKDGVFGPGGLNWAGAPNGATAEGYDDMANFYPTLLGVAAQ